MDSFSKASSCDLLEPPYRLLVIGRQGQLAQSLVKVAAEFPQVSLHCVGRDDLDLTSVEAIEPFLEGLSGVDGLINTAAYTQVDQAECDAENADAVNHRAVAYLAQWAKKTQVPFIQVSTDYVFDGRLGRPYRECDAPNPLNVYGTTKAQGEQAFLASGCQGWLVRTSGVFSEFGQNFVKTIVARAQAGLPLHVVNDQVTSPTYAPDLARVILRLICEDLQGIEPGSRDECLSGAAESAKLLHVANRGLCSWYDFAAEILGQTQLKTPLVPVSTQVFSQDRTPFAQRPVYSPLDCAKLEARFGEKLPSWQEALGECLKALQ